jgi:hypothetical protein
VSSFQDDLLRQFGQGVADIEGERVRKKREPTTTPVIPKTKFPEAGPSDWIGESFASGTEEIRRSRTEETPFLPAIGRAALAAGVHIAERAVGGIEYLSESQKRKRREQIDALDTIQREGAPAPKEKKEKAPEVPFEERIEDMDKFEVFMETLEEQLGKGVKAVGKGVEYARGTEPAKWL